MSGLAATNNPPLLDPPLDPSGQQHSQSWAAYYQDVSDRLATLATFKTGVTDGSDAAAGQIGEYLSASGGSVALANNVVGNVVSLDLTAGDWDVAGNVQFTAGSGNHNLFGAGVGGIDTFTQSTFPTTAVSVGISPATQRYNVTATTTVWLMAQASFSGSVTATGSIRARRMR